MPPRKWKFRLRHILEAIERIEEYTHGMECDNFRGDQKTIDAVVRNFLIIGEAARLVTEHVQETYPDIPWQVMSDMRNVLVHEYDRVKVEVIWDTIRTDLPALVPLLRKVLDEVPE